MAKAYREANPEKIRAGNKRWREANESYARLKAANPERLAIKAARTKASYRARKAMAIGNISTSEWQAIVDRQRGKCAKCGKARKLSLDHIVPLSRGGCNLPHNAQGLCSPCNSRKGNRIDPDVHYSLFDKVTNRGFNDSATCRVR